MVAPSFLADVIELFPFCFFLFWNYSGAEAEKLKTGYFNKLVLLTSLYQQGLHGELAEELGRLTTFRPLMPDVQRLCQKIQAEGAEALYSQGYIARKYQK